MKDIESRYAIKNDRVTNLKHTGFDYRGRMLLNSLDPILFKNNKILGFLQYVEGILNFLVKEVKKIKSFANIYVAKDYDKFN